MSVKKVSCRFEHFLSLLKKKQNLYAIVILLQYLLKMIVCLLFSNHRLLSVHQRLTKRIRTNYMNYVNYGLWNPEYRSRNLESH